MTDSQIAISTYSSFIVDQRKRLELLQTKRLGFALAAGIGLMVLLLLLGSPKSVWLFVGLLYAATYFGLDRVRLAFSRLSDAYRDLEDLTKFLAEPRSRDDVIRYIRPKVGPDGSNVPEAVASICSGNRTGESLRSAANAAFAQPMSKLALAHYLRSLLILGGLFGTVLFFAFSLGGKEILSGNVAVMLPELKGAMASTLSGILGSMLLGYLVSDADQMVEEAVWETEALFGGPLTEALAAIADDPRITNEPLLWQSLIDQVKALRDDTATSYGKLAADVNAYSLALKEVSTRLAELPQIQVPPQLVKLQDTVSEFSRGTETLHRTTTTLVDAVTKVGILAPAKTLEALGQIRQDLSTSAAEQRSIATGLQSRIDESMTSATSSIQKTVLESSREAAATMATHSGAIVEKVESLQPTLITASTELGELRSMIERMRTERSSVSFATAVASIDEASRPAAVLCELQGLLTELATVRSAVENLPARIPEALGHIEVESSVKIESESLQGIEALVRQQDSRLGTLAGDIGEMKQALARTTSRLGRLERMAEWLERANRAPIMWLLTLPWRRPRPAGSNGATP